MAVNAGRPDYATQAVEEYKLCAGGGSKLRIATGRLADLYFKIGRIKDAVTAAQDQVKRNPNDVAAHILFRAGLSAFAGRHAGLAVDRDAAACDRGVTRRLCG